MANSTTFDSISYMAVPDEIPDGPVVPEYEEIADEGQKEPSDNEKDSAAKTQHLYYSMGPQSLNDNHDCTIVSLLSINQFFSQGMQVNESKCKYGIFKSQICSGTY
jgi:hypothetical protein